MRRRQIISLTPLIDVVFILLVFFMLASSFTTWRSMPMDMAIPSGGGSSDGKSLLIEARTDGFRFGAQTVSREVLLQRLTERLATETDTRVLVRFDADLPLQQSVDLLDELAASGVRDLRILPARETVQ